MNAPAIAFVGLGGNIGDAAATLRAAIDDLDALSDTRLLRVSRLYRTPAWGNEDQPDFVNAVAMLETQLAPHALLEHLLAIERIHGRSRGADQRWGPRTIDLDLLLYGEAIIDEPGFHVPHPRLHLRAFALRPLLEVAPDITIPGIGRADTALAQLSDEGISVLDPNAGLFL